MSYEVTGPAEPSAAEARLAAYLDGIVSVLGHASRAASARAYCTGLLLPGERKSIEPMAARIAPAAVQAKHQSLHHVVAKAAWDDAAVLAAVRRSVLPAVERHGPIAYWIVDDTSFPKKGKHSVGVARQYCGQLGKQDNCQVAVSLSVANDHASLPVAYRLYLPPAWCEDAARRAKAGIPDEIGFATKTAIAVEQLRQALADGVPVGVVLADPASAPRPLSARLSPNSVCATCWACNPRPRSGHRARRPCRPSPSRARAVVARKPGCNARPAKTLYRPRRWP
jgi:SRSO17 transposase